MKLNHVAVWARDLEGLKEFYCACFGAAAGVKYVNAAKGFESYMVEFHEGGKLEIMRKAGLPEGPAESLGYAHFALSLGSETAVDEMAARLRAGGVPVVDGPRRTGDGFYECAVLDPEGNRVEIVA
jgi:lactoylglutathione lyase